MGSTDSTNSSCVTSLMSSCGTAAPPLAFHVYIPGFRTAAALVHCTPGAGSGMIAFIVDSPVAGVDSSRRRP